MAPEESITYLGTRLRSEFPSSRDWIFGDIHKR